MIKKAENKQQDPLVSFMKNQSSKVKNASEKKSDLKRENNLAQESKAKELDQDENLSDEEKLEQAKKESRAKSAQRVNVELIKKMLLKAIVKYVLIISIFCGTAILLIKALPMIFSFFHGLIHNILFSAL